MSFADFFAVDPPNSQQVLAGGAVNFPQANPSNTADITLVPNTVGEVNLANAGTYQVTFQVPVSGGGQLVLGLDTVDGSTELPNTVVGTNVAGTDSQIVGVSIVTTTSANSVLTVRNPTSSSPTSPQPAITTAKSTLNPVSAHLVITRIQ